MKHHLHIFLVALFFLPSLACGAFTTNSVTGSGILETQTVDVSNFDGVTLAAFGDVFIEQGDVESLSVQTDDNIIPLLDIKVTGGKLILDTKPNLNINPSQSITYNLTVRDLNSISLKGSGNFFVDVVKSNSMGISVLGSGDVTIKGLTADKLSIDLLGSGNITIDDIDVKAINTSLKGSGDIELAGKAGTQDITVAGSGNYMAEDLETSSADIRIPGSADITVWVSDNIKVSVNGSGNIRYYGKPDIDQSGLGSGNITSLGEK